jgi:hypothetical protein
MDKENVQTHAGTHKKSFSKDIFLKMAIPTGFIFADQGLLHLNDWLALYFALVR